MDSCRVKNAETLCLGLVAVAVFLVVMPLFKAAAGVLSQMTPASISASVLHKCLRQVYYAKVGLWGLLDFFAQGVCRDASNFNVCSYYISIHAICYIHVNMQSQPEYDRRSDGKCHPLISCYLVCGPSFLARFSILYIRQLGDTQCWPMSMCLAFFFSQRRSFY